jgi:hypothetical protein
VKGDAVVGAGIHRNTDPVPAGFRTDKAPELVSFGLQPLQDHRFGSGLRPDGALARAMRESAYGETWE